MLKFSLPVLLLFSVLFQSQAQDSAAILKEAREKMKAATVSWSAIFYYPNPVGEVMELKSKLQYRASELSSFDFLSENDQFATIFESDRLIEISHRDSLIQYFPLEDSLYVRERVRQNRYMVYSPLSWLGFPDWKFSADTVLDGEQVKKYTRVEYDAIKNGNKIFTQNILFISRNEALIRQAERRNFFNEDPPQILVFKYLNYDFSKEFLSSYEFPESYASKLYHKNEKQKSNLIEKGQPIPIFALADIDGDVIDIAPQKGKKLLLDFSVINCGYCKEAIDYFKINQEKLVEKFDGFYLNPLDPKEKVLLYHQKNKIPFTVMSDAEDFAKILGVGNGFPTFIIVNEKGLVEETILGFSKERFDKLLFE